MADEMVISRNPWIVIKKFLKGVGYTIGVAALSFAISFIPTIDLPAEYAIYTGIGISLLQAIKKAIEVYDPVKDR